MILLEIAKKIIPRVTGKAALYLDAATGRLRATRHSGTTWEGEDTARRGQASGYPSLNSSGYVPHGQLGSGGGGATKFLREDNSWQTVSGGSDHAGLTSLAWTASGHTGTASRLAGFNGSGAASYSQIGVDVQAYDAGLTSLTSADGSAGLPYVSGANVWASATYTNQLSVVSGTWKVVGLYETGGPTTLSVGSIPDGYFLKRSSTSIIGVAGTAVSGYYGDPFSIWMGTGLKGNVTFDGTTAVAGFSLASRVYTATTNDSYDYASITLDTTGGNLTIVTKGCPFRGKTIPTMIGSGTVILDFSGSDAITSAGGAGATALSGAPLRGGSTGGNGRATTGAGTAGSNLTSGVGMGGEGGHGGGTASNAGGNSGAITRPYDGSYGSLYLFMNNLFLLDAGGSTYTVYQAVGGCGGGGGGCVATATSGAGGGAGGGLYAGFGSIDTGSATLKIRVNGGNGANASAGGGSAGGGQGGAGGGLFFAARSITGTVVLEAKGGTGGNGAGTHGAGGDGGDGGWIVWLYGAGTAPSVSVAGGTKGTDVGSPTTPAVNGTAGTSVGGAL
jgi:hypothetical protein